MSTAGRGREAAVYLAALLLTALLLVPMLRLDRADLSLPLAWGDDAFYYQVLARGIVENGLTLSNPSLGAPLGMSLADAPVAINALHMGALRLLACFTSDHVLIVNVYYLASFILIALASLAVYRQFGISRPVALVVAILYAFAPYHLVRGERHLFLGAYYLVPLAVMVALWACQGLAGRRARLGGAVFVCGAIALGGPYYAFFTAFLLAAGGVCACWRHQRPRLLLEPLALVALIGVVGLLLTLPTLEWYRQNGVAPVMQRDAAEAELYGLRIAQMLLPVRGHVVLPMAELREKYEARMPPGETGPTSLGMVASLGFLLLVALAAACVLRGPPVESGLLCDAGFLNFAGLLLATTGGFGALVALTVLPQIRCYNRMSIFLAFLALLAVAVLLERWRERRPRATLVLCGLLLVAGLVDQVGTGAARDYGTISAEHAHDQAFVRQIEARLPRGAAVFQLPVISFIEGGPVEGCLGYDPARGYLHSRGLRWSYGVTRGREGYLWQRRVEALPVREMVEVLCFSGFAGVWLDRRGFAGDGTRVLDDFTRVLGEPPLVSGNGRFVFFGLVAHGRALRAGLTPRECSQREDDALHPLLASWGEGFYEQEGSGDNTLRWCSGEGRLDLFNRSATTRTATLRMTLVAPGKQRVRIEGLGLRDDVFADDRGVAWQRTLQVPPGQHRVRFSCDGPPVTAPGDSRRLVFHINNFAIESGSGLATPHS